MAKIEEKTEDPEQSDQDPAEETWKYSSEIESETAANNTDDSFDDISWSASEFVAHDKSILWYLSLSAITLVVTVLIYILTRDKISALVIVVAGGTLAFYAGRKPRLLNYKIDNSGLTIQDKLFSFNTFKSFAIVEDSAIPNIVLMPLKRFMPALSIYLDPATREEVTKVLSERLPQDLHHQAIVERFMQRVRF